MWAQIQSVCKKIRTFVQRSSIEENMHKQFCGQRYQQIREQKLSFLWFNVFLQGFYRLHFFQEIYFQMFFEEVFVVLFENC